MKSEGPSRNEPAKHANHTKTKIPFRVISVLSGLFRTPDLSLRISGRNRDQ